MKKSKYLFFAQYHGGKMDSIDVSLQGHAIIINTFKWCSQIYSVLFCWSRIFDWKIEKNKTKNLKIYLNETSKGKTNQIMIISNKYGQGFESHILDFTRLGITIRRRQIDHNCLFIIACPCRYIWTIPRVPTKHFYAHFY